MQVRKQKLEPDMEQQTSFKQEKEYDKAVYCHLAYITSHIHNWVLFLLWLHPFILSAVISPLISSSILGTYLPGEFLFQCHIILPFHTVHGVLKARILKWFTIPFSSGPHSVKSLHHDPPVLGGPTGMA